MQTSEMERRCAEVNAMPPSPLRDACVIQLRAEIMAAYKVRREVVASTTQRVIALVVCALALSLYTIMGG